MHMMTEMYKCHREVQIDCWGYSERETGSRWGIEKDSKEMVSFKPIIEG